MGMRVTTGMAMNLYRYNLQQATRKKDNSMNTVITHRKFNSFGESPAAATEAWRVRRSIVNTDIYLANNDDTYTRFNIAWATLGQVSSKLTDREGRMADIYAASDPTASGRTTLGQVLRETAVSVVQTMNGAKSGENFLFAGDDELYAPFTWGTDLWGNETLLYRGVDVNSGGVREPSVDPVPKYWGEIDPKTGLPSKMPNKIINSVDKAWAQYYEDLKTYKSDLVAYEEANLKYQKAHAAWEEAKEAYDEAKQNGLSDEELELLDPGAEPTFDMEKPTEPTSPAETFKTDPVDPEPKDSYNVPIDAYNILNGVDADGNPRTVTPEERAWAEFHVDQGNAEKLRRMSEEQVPIDLGMGMLEDDQTKLIDGTYYNRALPGINMLGFGYDEDGDPLNVCMIMRRLGEIYEDCHPETGSYDKEDSSGTSDKAQALRAEAMRLLDKLKAGQANVDGQFVEVSAKASFLEQNQGRLDLEANYLNEKLVNIEDVDPADAISQFMWDYTCYNAALKVGTQLLSQSLIDYMN